MVKCRVTAKRVGTVKDLAKKDLTIVTDSRDVREIKGYFGNRPAVRDFGGFLVDATEGYYRKAYGFKGNIPEHHKSVYKVKMVCK